MNYQVIENLYQQWGVSEGLRNHCRAVGEVMAAASEKYGQSEGDTREKWQLVGLCHDADYEIAGDEHHPNMIVDYLNERGEQEIAEAVASHYTGWGKPAISPAAKALLAVDELTGFIMAVAKIRPEGIATLSAKSVKKKLKDKSFARAVERPEVFAGVAALGVDLGGFIDFIIGVLKPMAVEFGIVGRDALANC